MKIRQLFISPGHNFFGRNGLPAGEHPTLEVPEIECVAGRGIKGDRFFDFKDDYKGQITFFSEEIFAAMCAELKLAGKSPGLSRRNVIVAGVELKTLVGVDFDIQGVRFHGTAECAPCHWMDHAFAPGAEHFLQNRGGLRAKIMTDGTLRAVA
jgi:MOSC domain-containing protein YiiM